MRVKAQKPVRIEKSLVLIVDDPYRTLRPLARLISPEDFTALWVPDEQRGLAILQNQSARVRIVIVDLKSSGMGGGGFLQRVRNLAPHAAVLITGPLGPFLYQECDFYEFNGPTLKQEINTILFSISQKMKAGRAHGERNTGRREVKDRFGPMIGRSQSINIIYRLIEI